MGINIFTCSIINILYSKNPKTEIIAICQHLNLIIPFIANISLTTIIKTTLSVRGEKIKRTTVRCALLTKRDAAIYVFYFQMLHQNSDLPRAYLHYLWVELLMERKLQNELWIIDTNKLLS